MKRTEWMNELERNLYVLGRSERENALSYYAELINDKLESGMRESDVLAGIGDPQTVALEIIANSESAERRSSDYRPHSGGRARENVIKEPVFDDDYFTQRNPPPVGANAAAAATPLKKRKKNVFVRIILPILGALLGAYVIYAGVVTIVDVSTKKEMTYEGDKAFIGLLLDIGSSDVEIVTGDKYSVTYTTSAIRRVQVDDSGDKLKIYDDNWLHSWAQIGDKMKITVPATLDVLDLTVSAGSLRVEEIECARAELEVSAGDVRLVNCDFAKSEINCSAGGIRIEDSTLGDTTIEMSAGSVRLEDVKVTSARATVSAGDLRLENLSVDSLLDVDVSAGSVKGRLVGKEKDFSVQVSVSAGSCNLQSAIRDADKRITVDVSAGSINLEFTE